MEGEREELRVVRAWRWPAVASGGQRWHGRLTTLCGVWFLLILPASMSGLVPLHFFSCPLPSSSWKTAISAEGASPFISLWSLSVASATTATSSPSSCALQKSTCFSTMQTSARHNYGRRPLPSINRKRCNLGVAEDDNALGSVLKPSP